MNKISKTYEDEDTEMLMKIIKLRKDLSKLPEYHFHIQLAYLVIVVASMRNPVDNH